MAAFHAAFPGEASPATEDAVTLMARYQVGEELAPGDVQAIVSSLGALAGELPTQ